ncbi:hypothetical protein [Spirilliplanes yamanashiensis]|uniref:Uncharacterized protein n=1 Tax=Spirilliplanes yamanashiensis TaxID=42233 RepID=A0A8J4DLN0_9ACTN|nr:hypothetical protein [Spirilliplanes yamanashiensis]MDP9818959.1 putative membrane protein YkgB [Spirilliplanes yamanashiensis]GIJ05414.1 hypothetical protein Sya03_47660 [Spirilliplanes yamanashiensis]
MHRSKGFVTGVVLAVLLGLGDLSTPLTSDGEHPPMAVGIACAVLGLITLAGVALAWTGRRGGVAAIVVTRVLSALTALPAFVADGVPGVIMVVAAVGIALNAAAIVLVTTTLRRPALSPAA